MTRVLVVEDEPDVAEVLDYGLRAAGFETTVCATGHEGLRLGQETQPDIILLDLLLPDMPGMQVCRKLKSMAATKDIPVVIVSACSDEIDRVVGFEVGADDYVVKPYSMRELLLRMRRSLERHSGVQSTNGVFRFGVVRLDINSHRAWVGKEEIELRVTEFKLLVSLCENPSRVLTRERLLELVWGKGSSVALRTVDAHVKRLRDRLGTAGAQIETVRGVGYRMTDELTMRHADSFPSQASVTAGDDIG
jgi:two-component system, OmpR family, phosphate regulon response regulator PhoB